MRHTQPTLKRTEITMNKLIRATRAAVPTLLALAWGVGPNSAAPVVLVERAKAGVR